VKRVTWFVGGVAAGAAGASYASRKVKSAATALAPGNVARKAADGVKSQVDRVRDAVEDGVGAMRAKEAEMRARREGRVEPLETGLEPGDRVLIEGRLVEPGQVVILRDEAARRRGRRHPTRRAH
jgi:hypothetical protein